MPDGLLEDVPLGQQPVGVPADAAPHIVDRVVDQSARQFEGGLVHEVQLEARLADDLGAGRPAVGAGRRFWSERRRIDDHRGGRRRGRGRRRRGRHRSHQGERGNGDHSTGQLREWEFHELPLLSSRPTIPRSTAGSHPQFRGNRGVHGAHPLEDQDTADVSGISLDGSGPDRSRSTRMSRASITP